MAQKKLSMRDVRALGLDEVEGHFTKQSEPFKSEDPAEIQSRLQELVQEGVITQEDVDQVAGEGDIIRLWQDEAGEWMVTVVTPQKEPLEMSLKATPTDPVDFEWPSEDIPF